MLKAGGSYLDKNGKKIKSDNILKDPMILNVIRNGGEINIPANRPDMYKFFTDMQKINPNIRVKQVGNVKGAFIKDELAKNLYSKINLKEFKKKSASEVERLEYFFNNIFKDKENMVDGLHIFINKIDKEFKNDYDLIIDIIVKKIITSLCLKSDLVIIHRKRENDFFEMLPTDEQIAKVISNELLLLFQKNKIKSINVLDYIIQQLPKDYTYKRIQCIIFECFNYLLNLANQSKRGEQNVS